MLTEITTWRDLKAYLDTLTEKQLDQAAQIVPGEAANMQFVEMQPAICIGTVAQMQFYGARSSIDNRWHAGEVVLLSDYNPFAEDGAVAYELDFNKTKKKKNDDPWKGKPIYPKGGKTPRLEQVATRYRKKANRRGLVGLKSCRAASRRAMEHGAVGKQLKRQMREIEARASGR